MPDERKRTRFDAVVKATSNRTLVWDLPTRVFHWMLAASFAGAYLTSESDRLRDLHMMLGYTAAGLVAFRLLWGLLGTRYARFTSFPLAPAAVGAYLKSLLALSPRHYFGHNPAGSWAVLGMLALVAATALSGWAHAVEAGPGWMEDVHEGLANATLALVVVHITAVVVSSVLHRDNLPRAMLSGYKPGAGPAAAGTRRAVAVALIALIAAFWSGAIPAPGVEAGKSIVQAATPSAGARGALRDRRHRDDD
jgi:cytochrome b